MNYPFITHTMMINGMIYMIKRGLERERRRKVDAPLLPMRSLRRCCSWLCQMWKKRKRETRRKKKKKKKKKRRKTPPLPPLPLLPQSTAHSPSHRHKGRVGVHIAPSPPLLLPLLLLLRPRPPLRHRNHASNHRRSPASCAPFPRLEHAPV